MLPLSTVVAFLLTGILRQYAFAHGLLDIPNDRSSHKTPTPRGGGIGIVAAFLAGLVLFAAIGIVDLATSVSLGGAGLVVAIVGFVDDHGSIRARWRLLAHFSAAAWALAWLGGFPPVRFLGMPADLGWFGHILALVYLVWMLNLYNFMDGIDGIAGLEALSVGLGATVIYSFRGLAGQDWALPALLALAAGGFLIWNFPPAKIFMGDAGSGFLGLLLGLMSIQAAWNGSGLFWSWVILLGVFVVDATVTLMRRLLRGEKLYEAHRSHAYQHAAQRFGSHQFVTLAVGAINVLWLLPIALAVTAGWLDGAVAVLIAYAPLVWLAFHLKAGAHA